jgi:twitching motility protein PilI
MANREALRDLQSRLAGRLQAARSEGVSVAAWLAVQAGGRDYLLPLNQAGNLSLDRRSARPIHTGLVSGIANLRGALMGVVDLAQVAGPWQCPQ